MTAGPQDAAPRTSLILALALIVALGFSAFMASTAQAASGTMSVRRFAVIVGSNDGGTSRVKLRYAGTDAKGFAGVLKTLGGLSAIDTVLVEDANVAQLRAAFATIATRIRSAGTTRQARTEVVVYYSGHSDEKGLLPGGVLLPYTELRQLVKALPADVRIVVLDSCASGALIRTKGGTKRPGFMVDASSNVKGQAIITSASADEQAQESDRIGASFFTHHLVSGLRGAADSDGDGKITLSEAYKHAFHETLRRTQGTASGPQHPNYDISLAGTGDVVITSLRSHKSVLALGRGIGGRLFVRDSRQRLVVELHKARGRSVDLGLSPGRYQLTLRRKAKVETASVVMRNGAKTKVGTKHFASQLAAVHRTRGNTPAGGMSNGRRYVSVTPVSVSRGVKARRGGPAPLVAHPEPVEKPKVAHPSTPLGPEAGTDIGNPTARATAETAVTSEDGPKGPQVAAGIQLVPGDTDRWIRGFSYNIVAGRNGSVEGWELGMVNLVTYDFSGLQMGIWNDVGRHVSGLQSSLLMNFADGDLSGAQFSGIGNVAWGASDGFQWSTFFNVANDFSGLQMSAGLNLSSSLDGAALGLVNVTGAASGLMLGLVNVADSMDGIALGLVNVIDGGYQKFEAWTSDTHALALGYKLGGQNFYTGLFVGLDPYHDMRLSFGFGLGVHAPLANRLSLDTDITASLGFQAEEVRTKGLEPVALFKLRVTVAYALTGRLGIFGGVTLNTAVAWDDGRYEMSLFGDMGTVGEQFVPLALTGGPAVSVWPGFVVGLQL